MAMVKLERFGQKQETPATTMSAAQEPRCVLPPDDAIGSQDRLDVLYIALDFTRPYTDPHWGDAWQ
jgi:hypothetical protein